MTQEPMSRLTLGISPCPNDTFMFDALVHGRVDTMGVTFDVTMDDIEALNERALDPTRRLDVTKVSAALLPMIHDHYVVLRSGAALGFGVGPLVVRRGDDVALRGLADLAGKRVGIPGVHTTAYALFRRYAPDTALVTPMRFERIMPKVASGELDAGVVIHESRFTYPDHGLVELADLGTLWERETSAPLPLGVIVARRNLDFAMLEGLSTWLRQSIARALEHPEASRTYVQRHAQELDPSVQDRHIALYVNERSLDLGDDGRRALALLTGVSM
jgi:1,4-dihydroxy-6-naphthoate synthase